jgi:hypothetical protein
MFEHHPLFEGHQKSPFRAYLDQIIAVTTKSLTFLKSEYRKPCKQLLKSIDMKI